MRTLMIVDDESLVRVGLQSLFDWESNGYRIVGAYKNGLDALEAIRQFCPDVLLTDIKMPVMDGFELIDAARRENPGLNIIILTSVEEYDCMRNALKHGVSDYILKYKIEQDELIRTLDALTYGVVSGDNRIEDRIAQGKRMIMELSSELSETKDSDKARASCGTLLDLMKTYGDSGAWIVIKPEGDAGFGDSVLIKASGIIIRETLDKYREVIYLGDDAAGIHAILCMKRALPAAEARELLSDILLPLTDSLQDKAGMKARIGVGSRVELADPLPVRVMRTSADKALLQSFYHEAVFFVDDPSCEMTVFTDKDWRDFRLELKQHIGKCDMGALADWMQSLEKRIYGLILPAEVAHLYRYIIQQVTDYSIDMLKTDTVAGPVSFHKLLECADKMEGVRSFAELSGISQGIVAELAKSIDMNASGKWVQMVTQYIALKCTETIRLRDAAQLVNFSESYFSMRFHQETGMSFSEYVTGERIRKAIEIMKTTDMSTDEIAEKVGYPNTNYFVKVFKKHTGKTISEFRKNR